MPDQNTTPNPTVSEQAIAAFMKGGDPFAIDNKPKTLRDENKLRVEQPPLPISAPVASAILAPLAPDPEVTLLNTEEAIQGALNILDKAPEKTWKEKLSKLGIKEEEASTIVDAMLAKGYYERTYQMTKKTSVTFRSRALDHQERAQRALENDAPQFSGTVGLIMAKYNLAASLVSVGTARFDPSDDGNYLRVFQYLAKLPFAVFNALCQKLAKFDQLVLTVMDEGVLENF
jgi:hypothetical protein